MKLLSRVRKGIAEHNLLASRPDAAPCVCIRRCVAKRKCFAPAAVYKPFGEQAAGVKSLTQFRALQEGEQEVANLRELGLTEPEMQLWRSRDVPEAGGKVRRLRGSGWFLMCGAVKTRFFT